MTAESKWALVTGASSGIGLAYSEELASRGYALVMVSNEEAVIHEKAQSIKAKYGVEVLSIYQDLAIPEAAKSLYDTCLAHGIFVEVLVNNAGMFFFYETLQVKSAVVDKMLHLHVVTTTELCYYFGQAMKKHGHGYILNMSSLSCWLPYPGITLYASTKRYLLSFSRGLRAELWDYGVSVTVLCPGAVATKLYNLSDDLQMLAIRLGVMMRPKKLAKRGIDAMFHRRAKLVPGLIYKIFTPLFMLLPLRFVRWAMHVSGLLRKDLPQK